MGTVKIGGQGAWSYFHDLVLTGPRHTKDRAIVEMNRTANLLCSSRFGDSQPRRRQKSGSWWGASEFLFSFSFRISTCTEDAQKEQELQDNNNMSTMEQTVLCPFKSSTLWHMPLANQRIAAATEEQMDELLCTYAAMVLHDDGHTASACLLSQVSMTYSQRDKSNSSQSCSQISALRNQVRQQAKDEVWCIPNLLFSREKGGKNIICTKGLPGVCGGPLQPILVISTLFLHTTVKSRENLDGGHFLILLT